MGALFAQTLVAVASGGGKMKSGRKDRFCLCLRPARRPTLIRADDRQSERASDCLLIGGDGVVSS